MIVAPSVRIRSRHGQSSFHVQSWSMIDFRDDFDVPLTIPLFVERLTEMFRQATQIFGPDFDGQRGDRLERCQVAIAVAGQQDFGCLLRNLQPWRDPLRESSTRRR